MKNDEYGDYLNRELTKIPKLSFRVKALIGLFGAALTWLLIHCQ